ncbi:MAG: autoinducer binding domain-containing protein [Casimicrobium sp.]
MNNSIELAFERIAVAPAPELLVGALTKVAAAAGYDSVAVAFARPPSAIGRAVTALTTYSSTWVSECMQIPAQSIALDPILKHLASSVRPLVWDEGTYADNKNVALYERFFGHGLGSGMTVNTRGARGESLSLGFTCGGRKAPSATSVLAELGSLCLAATAALHAFSRMEGAEVRADPEVHLTAREIELLRWSRCGKTAWESGNILGISQATAQFHLKNATHKLGVASKQQAVLRAMELRLIV